MRAGVGLLTRNIVIKGEESNSWGCRILVYGMLEGEIPLKGSVDMSAVEIRHCGQKNTEDAGLQFQNVWAGDKSSIVKSAIHSCVGFCLRVKSSSNISISENTFYFAEKYLVYLEEAGFTSISGNLMIHAQKRDDLNYGPGLYDNSACLYFNDVFDYKTASNSVYGNLCQGSDGIGFGLPHVNCDFLDNELFYDNTVGSATVGFIYNKNTLLQTCQGASNIKAYSCAIGLMANPAGYPQLSYSTMMFAENQRGLTLRFAHLGNDNYAKVTKTWFSPFVRPACPSCYSAATSAYCRNSHAVRMLSVTITGESFPLIRITPTGFDVICTKEIPDARAYFTDSRFEDYGDSYEQSFCGKNYVFIRHNLASDMTAGHYLRNVECVDCDPNWLMRADPPSLSWRGWFGGCGSMDCTGPNNYLVEDQTGQFLGFQGTLVANNTLVGSHLAQCTLVPNMNSYSCHRSDLAIMEFESVAPDMDRRVVWPVNVSWDPARWTNVINGWREWTWDGPEPMNTRNAKFISVMELDKAYNISYGSQPPSSALYRIQRKTLQGTAGYFIGQVYFPVPNSVRVTAKSRVVRTFRTDEQVDLHTKKDVCGAHTYFYENHTIHFVVSGEYDCEVKLELINSIQVTTRFSTTVAEFLNDNGASRFIDRICAFLGISTDRLKIVEVREGSAIIEFFIEEDSMVSASSSLPEEEKLSNTYRELVALSAKLELGLTNGQIEDMAQVLSYNSSVLVTTEGGEQYRVSSDEGGEVEVEPEKKTVSLGLLLGLLIPSVILLIAVIGVLGYCIYRKRTGKVHVNIEEVQIEEFDINKDGASMISSSLEEHRS